MRRETKKWLRTYVDDVMAEYAIPEERAAQDVLDTIAKLCAENRDLKARLKAVAKAPVSMVAYTAAEDEAADLALRAIDLKNKNWRKR